MLHASCTAVTVILRAETVVCCTRSLVRTKNGGKTVWSRQRVRETPFVPRSSYGRRMSRKDCRPDRDFLTYLFCDSGFAMHFLKGVGLLRSKVQCNSCGWDTWSAELCIPEGFRWRCRKKVDGVKCSESRSIKHGSWFQHSNLTFREILLISYDIVRREPARHIQQEYRLSSRTVTYWGIYFRQGRACVVCHNVSSVTSQIPPNTVTDIFTDTMALMLLTTLIYVSYAGHHRESRIVKPIQNCDVKTMCWN